MHGGPQYCHRPAGYRYSDDDQDYWYRDRQAPAAWEYWDDEDDDAGPADSATGGPLVILTSLAVIGTGIMLALPGPGPGIWLLAHKAAFVLWFGAMTIHVLAYLWRLPRLVGSDLARRAGYPGGPGPGRPGRTLAAAADRVTADRAAARRDHRSSCRSVGRRPRSGPVKDRSPVARQRPGTGPPFLIAFTADYGALTRCLAYVVVQYDAACPDCSLAAGVPIGATHGAGRCHGCTQGCGHRCVGAAAGLVHGRGTGT